MLNNFLFFSISYCSTCKQVRYSKPNQAERKGCNRSLRKMQRTIHPNVVVHSSKACKHREKLKS